MTRLEEAIANAAMQMSPEAKVELAHQLIAGLSDEEQRLIGEAWGDEVERRIEAMDRGEGSSKLSDEVVARLRKKRSA